MTAAPAIDRSAIMRRAHAIARQARPHMASYREALRYARFTISLVHYR